MANPVEVCVLFVCFLFTVLPYGKPSRKIGRFPFYFFTGLPYGKPSRKIGRFPFFFFSIFFRVGKSLACHSPGKWCLCAKGLLSVFS